MNPDQKLIEEINNHFPWKENGNIGIQEWLLSLFDQVRSQAIEEERKKIREVIEGMKRGMPEEVIRGSKEYWGEVRENQRYNSAFDDLLSSPALQTRDEK